MEEQLTLNPLIGEWFSRMLPTPPQKEAIPKILEGKNVLIASPTGSGKTLAIFIGIVSQLADMSKKNQLEDTVYVVYVSPLRSLSNDIRKNLLLPLTEIDTIAAKNGIAPPAIRIGIRTGDTPQSERTKMRMHPPHILITTPESLAIMITAPKFKEKLKTTKWLIIDEIHEVCNSKRGVHLSLTVERLERLTQGSLVRIGASATISPLEDIAAYLVGERDGNPRKCRIVDTRFVKDMKLEVTSPAPDLLKTPTSEVNKKMYDVVADLIKKYRTTLIFTNTRSGAERVTYHLAKEKIVDADELAAHHSSLSREVRLDVEDRLKAGKIRAIISSSSLELGIDIGSIDQVIQIGTPKSISRCLQRIGRAGHSLKEMSRGLLMGLERDDLVEDTAIALDAAKGKLDKVYIPRNALDVLSQQVVGMALEQDWTVDEAYDLVRRSYCYSDLPKDAFMRVIKYLAGMYSELEGHRVYGKIWYDEGKKMFGKRGSLLRVIYATNIGTIPDETAIQVFEGKRWVGSIEEEFLEKLGPGDVFVLGGKTFKFLKASRMRASVVSAEHAAPTVPSWFSEMLPLSFDLGESIGSMRREVFGALSDGKSVADAADGIRKKALVDGNASSAIVGYFDAERRFLRSIGIKEAPDNRNIIVENYVDDQDRQSIIFNCVFGRRVHDALARAFAQRLQADIKSSVMVSVQDSCFSLTLPEGRMYDPAWLLTRVTDANVRQTLLKAVKHTEVIKRRFRHCAARSLLVLRNYKGHQIRVGRQQYNSQILMRACEKLDRFPILEEAYREVTEDLMDIAKAEEVLHDVDLGKRKFIVTQELDIPSPFTHHLLVAGYTDVVLIEDRKKLLNDLYESVMARIESGEKRRNWLK